MAISLPAYVPNPIGAPQKRRVDYAAVQFLVNSSVAAGVQNADGAVWITADSSPFEAINNAFATWNAVTTTSAHISPPLGTDIGYSAGDGKNVITFSDDALARSFTGGILAITAISSHTDGTIVDTDIFFSPAAKFSTNLAPGTYDLQGILTHEVGHALGANHTNVLASAMYYQTGPVDPRQRFLTADDVAVITSLYPPAGGSGYGTISGNVTAGGAALLGGAIAAIDPFTGATISGFSSITDGSYSMQVPPGNYFLYVEPAVNMGFYLYDQTVSIFTSFQAAFAGGNNQPTLLQVDANATVSANVNAPAGLTPLRTPFIAIGSAGLTGDYRGSFITGPLSASSGQAIDLIFGNPINGTITESNILVLGPATMRPGSLRRDGTLQLNDGTPLYRITLDIPPLAQTSSVTLVFKSGNDMITRTGVLTLTRPQAVNAGSFLGGPVTPGEILSFFGSGLGPSTPSSNGGFDANGVLPATLAGVTANFDGNPAPLFYVSNSQINLQVPYEVASQSSTVLNISYNGTQVVRSTLNVAASAPGIFVVTNADGSVNGANSPVTAGGTLVIYGTGAGLTSGRLRTGAAAPDNSTTTATVTLGGQRVTPVYAGLTPGSVGLTQVNVIVPQGAATGNAVPLTVSINGNATQTVNVAIR